MTSTKAAGRVTRAGPPGAGQQPPCWSGRLGPSGSVFLLLFGCFSAEFSVCHCFPVILFGTWHLFGLHPVPAFCVRMLRSLCNLGTWLRAEGGSGTLSRSWGWNQGRVGRGQKALVHTLAPPDPTHEAPASAESRASSFPSAPASRGAAMGSPFSSRFSCLSRTRLRTAGEPGVPALALEPSEPGFAPWLSHLAAEHPSPSLGACSPPL